MPPVFDEMGNNQTLFSGAYSHFLVSASDPSALGLHNMRAYTWGLSEETGW